MTIEELKERLSKGGKVWVPVQTEGDRAVFVPQPRQILHVGTDTVHLADHPDTRHCFCYGSTEICLTRCRQLYYIYTGYAPERYPHH